MILGDAHCFVEIHFLNEPSNDNLNDTLLKCYHLVLKVSITFPLNFNVTFIMMITL